MQNPKIAPSRRNTLFLIVVIVSAICCGLTYLLYIQDLQSEARFQDWQSLGEPPESITKIVGVTFDGVIVQTISSKNYFYQILPVESKTAWKTYWRETQKELWLPSEDCGKKEQVEDAVQIEQAFGGTMHGFATICTFYMLKQDGNIYVKEKIDITDQGITLGLQISIIAGIAGLVLVLILYWIYTGFRNTR